MERDKSNGFGKGPAAKLIVIAFLKQKTHTPGHIQLLSALGKM